MKKLISGLLFMLFTNSLSAQTLKQCFKDASQKHGVPLETLYAVAFTESSFNPNAINRNTNGSKDVGLMQINDWWASRAHKMGYDWHDIKHSACANISFGSKILKQNYRVMKNWAQAIGAYNAGYKKTLRQYKRRANYYKKVKRNKRSYRKHLHRLNKHSSGAAY